MTAQEIKKAKSIIKRHYQMTRPITDYELVSEITILKRHSANGTLWDNMLHYYCKMEKLFAW